MMLDKTGREIRVGDTLKIYHFTGRRRKKYYMYKYIQGIRDFGTWSAFIVNHLSKEFKLDDIYYLKIEENKIFYDTEIVQGYNNKNNELSYEDRPKFAMKVEVDNDK